MWSERSASGVLCDQRIPVRLKQYKFDRSVVRPLIQLYGLESWAVDRQTEYECGGNHECSDKKNR